MNEAPRYGTQGGGMVVAAGKGRYVFVSDPPTGFKIGDYMPEEWGIAGPFDSKGKPIEIEESDTF